MSQAPNNKFPHLIVFMIKSNKKFESLFDKMSAEVKEPITVENVPANSAVMLVKPTECLRVKWDREIGEWIEFGMEP